MKLFKFSLLITSSRANLNKVFSAVILLSTFSPRFSMQIPNFYSWFRSIIPLNISKSEKSLLNKITLLSIKKSLIWTHKFLLNSITFIALMKYLFIVNFLPFETKYSRIKNGPSKICDGQPLKNLK